MLRKLFKYEFIASGRQLGPLYLLTILVAIIVRLSFSFDNELFISLSLTVFTAICTAVAVMTLVIVIQRFANNVLGDEGYLTMTLPVKTASIIWAKLLNALLYVFFGCIVAFVAFAIVADIFQVIPYLFSAALWQEVRETLAIIPMGGYLVALNFALMCILGLAATILMVYLSASIGQLPFAHKHRTAASFVIFIVLSIIITQICGSFFVELPWDNMYIYPADATSETACHMLNVILGVVNAITLVIAAGCFAGTNYILKNKLNLQ